MIRLFRYMTGIYLFSLLLLSPIASVAQAPVSTDSLFRQAQQLAFDGKYAESRAIAKAILQATPAHTDAKLLLGRTYAWQHEYDSARAVLQPLTRQEIPSPEPYLVLANLELWDKEPVRSLRYAEQGLVLEPANQQLNLAKAKALRHLNRNQEVVGVLQAILKREPANQEAKDLLAFILELTRTNRIRLEHQVSSFDERTSVWQLSSLEYRRATPNGSKYLARINYAQRYSEQSMQAELEAYPQLAEKTYAYFTVGLSDKKLFPTFRTGIELHRLLPYELEASLGVRTLLFPSETVMLYTGHIGKYLKKQWVSFRPYLQKQGVNWETTGVLHLRQYLRDEDEFITLVLSKGSTPAMLVAYQEIMRLDASRVALENQFRLGKGFLLGSALAYEHEEYQEGNFRSRYTGSLSVLVKF
ncbi:YaiO family outer membrane protein [Pontibacter ummariensis]|uniref:Outer membrane protein, YaiO family n=1 Tax=Pontibacter ummariensis TaxID=1610492 RepID=A0A239GH54_9BACT|nr:YaiO family outer membrane beta-barrel protein [Pontibacter ummariensis]PRY11266.1 YaiO family outer membrane protein [Pontibacter ummariensis]SNS68460.1 outer membrane protein, YaiO family [Pontibacter ummariensis]